MRAPHYFPYAKFKGLSSSACLGSSWLGTCVGWYDIQAWTSEVWVAGTARGIWARTTRGLVGPLVAWKMTRLAGTGDPLWWKGPFSFFGASGGRPAAWVQVSHRC